MAMDRKHQGQIPGVGRDVTRECRLDDLDELPATAMAAQVAGDVLGRPQRRLRDARPRAGSDPRGQLDPHPGEDGEVVLKQPETRILVVAEDPEFAEL